jgi:branched-chain amino acid transport system substrate-binding protein
VPRVRTAGAVLVVGAIGISACSGDDQQATVTTSTVVATTTTIVPRDDDGVLSIGAFLPRTGPGAALGEPMIAAVEQAVAEINSSGGVLGSQVELTVVDESSGTGIGALLDVGVDAVIGPASSTVALSQLGEAVVPVSGVVTCSPSATALALDGFPDNKLFFRTVPSDSLQMTAIERRAERTGVESVAVGYLDDPYGRGLSDAFVSEVEGRARLELRARVGFDPDQENLSDVAAELLKVDPGVIVVLGDADDGTRLLAALDEATGGSTSVQVIVNDAIRGGSQAIQALSPGFRHVLSGVAPLAVSPMEAAPEGFFAANAADCVNLIALAAIQAGSDAPSKIQAFMSSVSVGGRVCMGFADCAGKLGDGLLIDYNGFSGTVDLSTTTGDLVRASFEAFGFNDEGVDHALEGVSPFEVP